LKLETGYEYSNREHPLRSGDRAKISLITAELNIIIESYNASTHMPSMHTSNELPPANDTRGRFSKVERDKVMRHGGVEDSLSAGFEFEFEF